MFAMNNEFAPGTRGISVRDLCGGGVGARRADGHRALTSRAPVAAARVFGVAGVSGGTLRRTRPRLLSTKVRDYFTRDDVRPGYTVAFRKRDAPHIAVVLDDKRRRQLSVLDHLGEHSVVELKHVDLVLPTVGDKLSTAQLSAAAAAAAEAVEADAVSGGVVAMRAWERVVASTHNDDATSALRLADVAFPRDDPVSIAARTAAEAARAPPEVFTAYAAYRVLAEDGFYFRAHRRAAFSPRSVSELASLRREMEEQASEDESRRAMWRRLSDAVDAPPGAKPSRDAFTDGTLLELRMEALEAFALGDGCYSAGQKAAAVDTLGRLNMQPTERGAFDLLVAVGRWSAHENLGLRRYDVPVAFDTSHAAAAAALMSHPPDDVDESSRKDLTRMTVYAIDSDDTVEIDDGISAERLEDGKGIRVWIHVADATRVVHRGTPLDLEARRRGSSGYLPTGVVSMFPLDLAGDAMSLAKNKERCAVSVTAVLNEDGGVEEYWMGPSRVRVTHQMTEEEAGDVLEHSPGSHPVLALLKEAADRRKKHREAAGAVTINMPEAEVKVRRRRNDASGGGGAPAEEDDGAERVKAKGSAGEKAARAVRAHEAATFEVVAKTLGSSPVRDLVGEMMILSGELVAKLGQTHGVPMPYRGQTPPRLPSSEELAKLPEGLCQAMALRMSMTRSNQGATPRPHASLGLDAYVQFSSPIRRYTDMIAHYQVKARIGRAVRTFVLTTSVVHAVCMPRSE